MMTIVIITMKILEEYNEVLRRKKFHFSEKVVKTVVDWFVRNATFIEVEETNYTNEVLDEKDRIFYAAAKCTKSRLVTGNVKHYPVEEMITMLWEIK